MKKKALLLVLAAALIVVASIGGTLAWLTSKPEAITNTFTVGDLTITLDEPSWEPNEDGNRVIVPGTSVEKDPTVTLEAGSEEADIYMTVSLPASIKGHVTSSPAKITFDVDSDWQWVSTTGDKGYYKYMGTLDTNGDTDPLFTKVTFASTLTDTDMEALADAAEASDDDVLGIKVTAYAIQKDGDVDDLGIVAGDKIA